MLKGHFPGKASIIIESLINPDDKFMLFKGACLPEDIPCNECKSQGQQRQQATCDEYHLKVRVAEDKTKKGR